MMLIKTMFHINHQKKYGLQTKLIIFCKTLFLTLRQHENRFHSNITFSCCIFNLFLSNNSFSYSCQGTHMFLIGLQSWNFSKLIDEQHQHIYKTIYNHNFLSQKQRIVSSEYKPQYMEMMFLTTFHKKYNLLTILANFISLNKCLLVKIYY